MFIAINVILRLYNIQFFLSLGGSIKAEQLGKFVITKINEIETLIARNRQIQANLHFKIRVIAKQSIMISNDSFKCFLKIEMFVVQLSR